MKFVLKEDMILTALQTQWLMSDHVNALTNMSIPDPGSNNALFKSDSSSNLVD